MSCDTILTGGENKKLKKFQFIISLKDMNEIIKSS